MSAFGTLERRIGQALYAVPALRNTAKVMYQAANLAFFGGWRGPPAIVQTGCRLFDAADAWSGEEIGSTEETFFGYFETSPWSADGGSYILNARRGLGLDVCVLNVVEGGVRFRASTNVWNYQQGALAQWCGNHVIYNCVRGGRLGAFLDRDWLEWPVQCVHPSQPLYLTLNWGPINRWRPDYAYKDVTFGTADIYVDEINVIDGTRERLIAWDQLLSRLPQLRVETTEVNHPKYSPDGRRVAFIIRTYGNDRIAQLAVLDRDDRSIRVPLSNASTSHYCWLDETHLFCWAFAPGRGGAYRVVDCARESEIEIRSLAGFGDGHPSASIAAERVITDTYPDRSRRQYLMLMELRGLPRSTREIASLYSPLTLNPENRCDLHPRWSPCGGYISIDSCHMGIRRNYIIKCEPDVRDAFYVRS